MISLNWISVKEAAQLENVNERTIQRNINKNVYAHIRLINGIGGKSGKQYEVALESLSEGAQALYNNQVQHPDNKAMLKYSGEQRKQADLKALIVSQYQQSGLSIDEFIFRFNQENIDRKSVV